MEALNPGECGSPGSIEEVPDDQQPTRDCRACTELGARHLCADATLERRDTADQQLVAAQSLASDTVLVPVEPGPVPPLTTADRGSPGSPAAAQSS
jgi:hypothetical protein